MNNKGQTLVIFVLLLPLFILMGAYMIDSGYILIEKNKLDDIAELASDSYYKNSLEEEETRKLILANDADIEILQCSVNNGKVDIRLKKNIESIFGKLIGYKEYEINSSVTIRN